MTKIHRLVLNPPILNSSSLWASSRVQLEKLYLSDWTGGVTTRTATANGFAEDSNVHKHALVHRDISINSYGYSPHPLSQYLTWIRMMLSSSTRKGFKPFIISIAPASARELSEMLDSIQELRRTMKDTAPEFSKIGIELNTSCPNIPGHPPPAYDPQSLSPLLAVFRARFEQDPTLTIGLKLAPYVHAGQFQRVVDMLASVSTVASDGKKTNCVSFLSCTNTLGSALVFQDQVTPDAEGEFSSTSEYAVPTITGGLAGGPIHALSLGNVYTFRKLLSEHPDTSLQQISIIGIGGVTSKAAVMRMRRAGASAVACATALGMHGVEVFHKLNEGS